MTTTAQYETAQQSETAQAYVDALNLDYQPQFKPGDPDAEWRCISWDCVINGQSFEYHQGLGYYPWTIKKHGGANSIMRREMENELIKTGRIGWGKAKPPALVDVLYSLIMDVSVLNYTSFEDWAGDFGYDPDSRKAEQTYKACIDGALKLLQFIPNLDEATEAFQDY